MSQPLAERLRPQKLEDWVGHSEVMSPGSPVYDAIAKDKLFSFILYAPPGSGKTSLCFLIKRLTKNRFVSLSAVTAGVKDVKAVIDASILWKNSQRQDTIVFIDEIHRFSKSQQDVLLGAVERGEIILLGATTENPSYEINSALLSRVRVFRMEALTQLDLLEILKRAVQLLDTEYTLVIEPGALEEVASLSQGDARAALNVLERLAPDVSLARVRKIFSHRSVYHDKHGDLHHQVVSAFIKSMRAGQTDAALYYLARLWLAGEDPLYIARRMVIFASEDIGNADLKAIGLMNAIKSAVEFVGYPECHYALSQGVIYLSKAPKSRDAGASFDHALARAKQTGAVPPPKFLMNANTSLDRDLGRGRPRQEGESFLPEPSEIEN